MDLMSTPSWNISHSGDISRSLRKMIMLLIVITDGLKIDFKTTTHTLCYMGEKEKGFA
jgi:hypothetical protein